jgi:PAS domain S-box-containing protein
MSWSYSYDPQIWPALITLALLIVLGWYSWGKRKVPGARYFAFGCLLAALWTLGTALEISAVGFSSKVFWIKFQAPWQLPAVTALTCFVLEYAGLGRWLSRRNLVLLAIPPLLVIILIITNNYHHLFWTRFWMDGVIHQSNTVVNWIGHLYAYLFSLISVIILIWLAFRSPQHRWPIVLMLFGQISTRLLFILDYIKSGILGPGESILVMVGFLFSMYALALFRFRVFDPVQLARSAVIEQMGDGMLVLDLKGKIVEVNPAAGKIFAEQQKDLPGCLITDVLPVYQGILLQDKAEMLHSEISLGSGRSVRHFNLDLNKLKDKRGQIVGQLILLHDVTEQKLAQSAVLEQQRMVATLQERERLARELHDSTGQVLGYLSLQAQAIRQWLLSGNSEKAGSQLSRLAEVAQDAHADVRESILSLRTGSGPDWSFLLTLKQYLADFQGYCDIRTELVLPDGLKDDVFEPGAGVQLLRVIQESLTNARKHSGAHTVRIIIEVEDSLVRITVTDNGCGFDAEQLNPQSGRHFGLAFMRERMAQIGGSVTIDSRPGAGTVVILEAPVRN